MTMHHLNIITLPGGETEHIEFLSAAAAINHWSERAYELTRKGWKYDNTISEDVLSRFTKDGKSITVYLGES